MKKNSILTPKTRWFKQCPRGCQQRQLQFTKTESPFPMKRTHPNRALLKVCSVPQHWLKKNDPRWNSCLPCLGWVKGGAGIILESWIQESYSSIQGYLPCLRLLLPNLFYCFHSLWQNRTERSSQLIVLIHFFPLKLLWLGTVAKRC